MPPDLGELTLARALAFHGRQHSGAPWTAGDEAALHAWLEAAPQHRAAYERVVRAWAAAGELEGHIPRTPLPRRSPGRQYLAACAAVLLAAIALPLGRTGHQAWYQAQTRWISAPGQMRTLVLADGTQVVMDGGSELVAHTGGGRRQVSLTRGEALFTVRHDAARPFEVEVAGGMIRDLGTRFDVELLGGTAHVAVLAGEVALLTPRGGQPLEAGIAGGYGPDGAFLPLRQAGPSTGPGNVRRFDAEPLPDVLERLARHHAVSFVYADRSVRELRLSGTFRLDDLATFLRTLAVALPVETQRLDPDRIEISRRDPPAH